MACVKPIVMKKSKSVRKLVGMPMLMITALANVRTERNLMVKNASARVRLVVFIAKRVGAAMEYVVRKGQCIVMLLSEFVVKVRLRIKTAGVKGV